MLCLACSEQKQQLTIFLSTSWQLVCVGKNGLLVAFQISGLLFWKKITLVTCSKLHSTDKSSFLDNTCEIVVIWLSSACDFPKFSCAVCRQVCFAVLKLHTYRPRVVVFSRAKRIHTFTTVACFSVLQLCFPRLPLVSTACVCFKFWLFFYKLFLLPP